MNGKSKYDKNITIINHTTAIQSEHEGLLCCFTRLVSSVARILLRERP